MALRIAARSRVSEDAVAEVMDVLIEAVLKILSVERELAKQVYYAQIQIRACINPLASIKSEHDGVSGPISIHCPSLANKSSKMVRRRNDFATADCRAELEVLSDRTASRASSCYPSM